MADSNEVIGETLRHILETLVSIRDSIDGVRRRQNVSDQDIVALIKNETERLTAIAIRQEQMIEELAGLRVELEELRAKENKRWDKLWRKV